METENNTNINEETAERVEGSAPEDVTAGSGQPYADQSVNEQPVNEQPVNEQPTNEQHNSGQPYSGQSYYEQPYSDTPDVSDSKVDKKTFLRACRGWTDILPIAAALSVLLSLFGTALTAILINTVLPVREWGMQLIGDADSVAFLLQYFDFFGIWIAFLLVVLVFKSNWPMWKAFFYNGHGNNLKSILIGILVGFGANGFCVLMSCIMGDIKLSFNEFRPVVFFVFLFCVWIQSGAEEIVDRCYFYQKLRRRYRWPAIAILGNSLVFMAMHMANPGVTVWGLGQVFLVGVLFSLFVYYWDSLWTAIWAHTAWNFSQSIVFGLPNSGIVSKYSVFKLEAASATDGIFYNTNFGVEGSIGANVIFAALIVIILIYGIVTKRGEKVDHWAEMEELDAKRNHIWEAVVLTVIIVGLLAAGFFVNRWVEQHADEIQQIQEQLEQMNEEEEAEAAGQPAVEGPATVEPAAVEPAAEPAAEPTAEPAAVEPVAEPVAEPAAVEQPAEEPAEEPAAVEEPAEEPTEEEPVTEQW